MDSLWTGERPRRSWPASTQGSAAIGGVSDGLGLRAIDHQHAPGQFVAVGGISADLRRTPEPSTREMELRRDFALRLCAAHAGLGRVEDRLEFLQARQAPTFTPLIAGSFGLIPVDIAPIILLGPFQPGARVFQGAIPEVRPANRRCRHTVRGDRALKGKEG